MGGLFFIGANILQFIYFLSDKLGYDTNILFVRKRLEQMKDGQLSWRARGALWLRLGVRLVLAAAVVFLALRFGRTAISLFAPFLLALGVAAALEVPIRWIQKRSRCPRGMLALLLILALLGLLGGGLYLLGHMAVEELVSLAENRNALLQAAKDLLAEIDRIMWDLAEMLPFPVVLPEKGVLDWVISALPDAVPDLGNIADYVGEKAATVSSFLLALVFFLLAAYFLTADYPALRKKAVERMDRRTLRFCRQVRGAAMGAFGGYLKAQVVLSVGVFFILLGGFLLVRQEYSFLLALGLAVLDFIPLLGAGTGMVPWAVVSFLTGNYTTGIQVLVIWGLVTLFRRVMEPKIVGNQTGLSPVLSLISIYVGMRLGGVLGMILGPILVLVCINLGRLGVFDGVRRDLCAAVNDTAAILSGRPE